MDVVSGEVAKMCRSGLFQTNRVENDPGNMREVMSEAVDSVRRSMMRDRVE